MAVYSAAKIVTMNKEEYAQNRRLAPVRYPGIRARHPCAARHNPRLRYVQPVFPADFYTVGKSDFQFFSAGDGRRSFAQDFKPQFFPQTFRYSESERAGIRYRRNRN
jgi:hypothetical protein